MLFQGKNNETPDLNKAINVVPINTAYNEIAGLGLQKTI
jgi:hypothetical protein